jgi:hypothetical protein
MYTSEIRETDQEGKPVTVSPALFERVQRADEALRERLDTESGLRYAGRWTFPKSEEALLSLTVQIPNRPESYAVSLPFNPQNAEAFPRQAVQSVLRQAAKAIQARFDRRLHDLLVSSAEDE